MGDGQPKSKKITYFKNFSKTIRYFFLVVSLPDNNRSNITSNSGANQPVVIASGMSGQIAQGSSAVAEATATIPTEPGEGDGNFGRTMPRRSGRTVKPPDRLML